MKRIDFRSDTVTLPTAKMREAMARAAVGDDVYGEDPTINELETRSAAIMGKDAGMFVPSGTMGNLTGILSQASRGDEAIIGFDSHTLRSEAGGLAVLGSVVPKALPTDNLGRMSLDLIEDAINPDDPHKTRSRLIVLENSYGAKAGAPIPVSYFEGVREIASKNSLLIHLDGARIFNAALALDIEPQDLTKYVDTVTFCFSKGLGAPVGSMLCGSWETIHQARRIRKIVGGSMRQAGILAAAALVALDEMVDRLAEDHENAHFLSEGLAQIPGIIIEYEPVRTNMVFFQLDRNLPLSATTVAELMAQRASLLLNVRGEMSFRAVTHYGIGKAEVKILLETIGNILTEERAIHSGGRNK